ncbi:endonuclease/exonuclease/phosphatase family protein [Prevotella sp.]|uniref:endonuclease/exonuclease/phosphatase family protein n=1 Tax=Prevotella sp. TaxID=59823 RepID=UPI0039C228DF
MPMRGKDATTTTCLCAYGFRITVLAACLLLVSTTARSRQRNDDSTRPFTFVELNCENLFDNSHDTLKQDTEWMSESPRHWTYKRYRQKLNNIGKEIIACGENDGNWRLPDIVALCEVENDSVLRDLTRRSLLRTSRYEYIVTESPDLRGIDVALLFSPSSFRLISHRSIRVKPLKNMRPTRDILYANGLIISGDTLHIFVVHAPSRYGGEHSTRPYRLQVAKTLASAIDSIYSISPDAAILVAGDFNDYHDDPAPHLLYRHGLQNITADAKGSNGALGTYKYKGEWRSIDHIMASPKMSRRVTRSYISDPMFLLEDDEKYGGKTPLRTYNGFKYKGGYSDHLPLVARFGLEVAE